MEDSTETARQRLAETVENEATPRHAALHYSASCQRSPMFGVITVRLVLSGSTTRLTGLCANVLSSAAAAAADTRCRRLTTRRHGADLIAGRHTCAVVPRPVSSIECCTWLGNCTCPHGIAVPCDGTSGGRRSGRYRSGRDGTAFLRCLKEQNRFTSAETTRSSTPRTDASGVNKTVGPRAGGGGVTTDRPTDR